MLETKEEAIKNKIEQITGFKLKDKSNLILETGKHLRPFSIKKVLLLSSSYDYFLLEEEGRIEGHPGYSYEVVTRELSGVTPDSRDKGGSTDFSNDEKPRGKSRLYEIAVTVRYKDLGGERRFSLATILYDQPSLKAPKDESR